MKLFVALVSLVTIVPVPAMPGMGVVVAVAFMISILFFVSMVPVSFMLAVSFVFLAFITAAVIGAVLFPILPGVFERRGSFVACGDAVLETANGILDFHFVQSHDSVRGNRQVRARAGGDNISWTWYLRIDALQGLAELPGYRTSDKEQIGVAGRLHSGDACPLCRAVQPQSLQRVTAAGELEGGQCSRTSVVDKT